ncbi:MAG: RNA-binding S4 domain-containing protein [Alphaproteobacteria bacterium]|nr:RNA-binding S4 domain-containing protein [Alphaproteobacteria bacterium]
MAADPAHETIRVDKWLWHARFAKTRSVAAGLVKDGVRLNGTRIAKPAAQVGPGDVLTFAIGARVRVVKVLGLGTRRGPAPEAQALYDDLSPPPPPPDLSAPKRVGPRPDKRARRRFAAPAPDRLD